MTYEDERRTGPAPIGSEDWYESVGELDPTARGELLEAARAGRLEAGELRAVVLALGESLDPRSSTDRDLLRRVLDGMREPDSRAARFLEGLRTHGQDPDLRNRATMALAIGAGLSGENDRAVRLLLDLLDEVAGSGTELEARTLVNLSVSYRRQERDVESIVVLRRALAVLGGLDLPDGQAFATVSLASALHLLGENELARIRLDEAEATLSERIGEPARFEMHLLRAFADLELGDVAGARADLAVAAEGIGDRPDHDHRRVRLGLGEAKLALVRDRPSAALEILAGIEEAAGLRDESRHDLALFRAEALLRLGRPDAAERIEACVRELAGSAGGEFGWNRTTDRALAALELVRRIDRPDLVRETLDLAATAILHRMRELDVAMASDLAGSPLADEDRKILKRARARFAKENRELCRRVVERLGHEGHDPARWAKERLAGDRGISTVCAWCLRARTAEGVWLPIGHFLGEHESFRVTHGMCDDCLREVRARRKATPRGPSSSSSPPSSSATPPDRPS